MLNRLLADGVLILHAVFIGFVVMGLVLTLVGGAMGWRWVHRPWPRLTHLAAIGYVVVQQWLGILCPLTVLENHLRQAGGQAGYEPQGFIAHWLHAVIFYRAPWWVFAVAYTLFGLLVALSFWWVPLQRNPRAPRHAG